VKCIYTRVPPFYSKKNKINSNRTLISFLFSLKFVVNVITSKESIFSTAVAFTSKTPSSMVRRETSEVPFAFLPAFLPSCQKTISKGKTKLIKSDREDEKIERNAFKTKPSNNSFFFFT
jgi:hypothetical protein